MGGPEGGNENQAPPAVDLGALIQARVTAQDQPVRRLAARLHELARSLALLDAGAGADAGGGCSDAGGGCSDRAAMATGDGGAGSSPAAMLTRAEIAAAAAACLDSLDADLAAHRETLACNALAAECCATAARAAAHPGGCVGCFFFFFFFFFFYIFFGFEVGLAVGWLAPVAVFVSLLLMLLLFDVFVDRRGGGLVCGRITFIFFCCNENGGARAIFTFFFFFLLFSPFFCLPRSAYSRHENQQVWANNNRIF
jgi:hypothetical protein